MEFVLTYFSVSPTKKKKLQKKPRVVLPRAVPYRISRKSVEPCKSNTQLTGRPSRRCPVQIAVNLLAIVMNLRVANV